MRVTIDLHSWVAMAMLFCFALCPALRAQEPPKIETYPVPDAVADSPFTIEADGRNVPIEQAGHIEKAYYGRFQLFANVNVAVTAESDAAVTFDLRPERFRTDVVTEAKTIRFSVKEPGPRVVQMTSNGKPLPKLFIIVDRPDRETQAARGDRIFNVEDFGVTHEGDQTKNVQKALDACAAAGGGTVYFGPGAYTTGMIRIGDNTRVYLAPGSLLLAAEDPELYPRSPRLRQLILFDKSKNSSIAGYGVVDSKGHKLNADPRFEKSLFGLCKAVEAENMRIENVVFRNSFRWTLHPSACRNVTIDNLKIISDWGVRNTDGIDPDGCENVTITNYFGHCGDDAVVVKTTHWAYSARPARNIACRDSVVVCRKTCLKLGTESLSDISNVVFENIDCVNSSRGIGLWSRDGGTFSNVSFKNIRMNLIEIDGEKLSGQPFRITVEKRKGLGKIEKVSLDDIEIAAPYYSYICGSKDSPLREIAFTNCHWTILPGTHDIANLPLVDVRHADEVAFRDCTRRWLGKRLGFTEFIHAGDSERVQADVKDVP